MTVHKLVILKCDSCGTTAVPPTMVIGDVVNLEHPAPEGVVDARHRAAAKGWSHTAKNRDLCPACGPAKPEGTRSKLLSKIPHPHLHWGE